VKRSKRPTKKGLKSAKNMAPVSPPDPADLIFNFAQPAALDQKCVSSWLAVLKAYF
jgi:hypothetical protein